MAPSLVQSGLGNETTKTTTSKNAADGSQPPTISVREDSHNDTELLSRLSALPNLSLFVTPEHTLRLSKTPVPTPAPNQVLIHVKATGICGSDLHLWKRGAIGPLVVDRESILGHEAAGRVLAVGSQVTNVKPGDRIAIEPGVPCDVCFLCQKGRYNLCEDVRFAGVCPYPGTIRRFMCHEAKFVHKIPDDMSYAQAALLEPLSVVVHALEQQRLRLGRPALICGAGPIGLTALSAARASGCWPLAITDIEEKRLQFAQELVPGVKTYLVTKERTSEEAAAEIRQLYNAASGVNEYDAPEVVLECTGIESSVATACYSCRRGGNVMVIGVGRSIMNNLPFMHLSLAEIQLKFTNRYIDTWPAGINILSGGVINLDKLITHTFPLENALDALQLCSDTSKGSIKVQIVDDVEI